MFNKLLQEKDEFRKELSSLQMIVLGKRAWDTARLENLAVSKLKGMGSGFYRGYMQQWSSKKLLK